MFVSTFETSLEALQAVPEEEEEEEEDDEEAAPQIEATELTVTQILKIVPRVKRSNKKAVQQSALDLGTIAQIKNLQKRLHLQESDGK
ncbi:MAG: hypothetical protein VXW22_14090, partial [Pseudomonadota bacterium]|nr:hypothetical protein [Pseudomonadota bacterium]